MKTSSLVMLHTHLLLVLKDSSLPLKRIKASTRINLILLDRNKIHWRQINCIRTPGYWSGYSNQELPQSLASFRILCQISEKNSRSGASGFSDASSGNDSQTSRSFLVLVSCRRFQRSVLLSGESRAGWRTQRSPISVIWTAFA